MSLLTDFVIQHEEEDCSRLLLSRCKWPEIDMDLAVNTIEARKRLKKKLPEWYACDSLIYPDRLCAEQCSSSKTAAYKAEVAASFFNKPKIADLTGGLGVDTWAFSKIASELLYNEMKPYLAKAASHNFQQLGLANIRTVSSELREDNLDGILSGFKPDIIFLDPARRDALGKKVFLLEDCSPDILTLKDRLLDSASLLMLKLSPMADISMLLKRLGQNVMHLHIVESAGECKELLLILKREPSSDPLIIINANGKLISFPASSEQSAKARYLTSLPGSSSLLFEPGKALAKSGLFNTVSEYFGLKKFSPSTHLYTADSVPSDFGKSYEIVEIKPLNKQSIKETGRQYPQAEVTARNIALSSDELRKRLKVRSGSQYHIFGARLMSDNYLVVCRQI